MKPIFFKIALVAVIAIVSAVNIFKAKGSDAETFAADLKGCLNGPNLVGYCFINDGVYSCESDYWIYNCLTAVN